MKSVSIFEKRWIDLVFEGKNKSYGAYQLRNENSKTSLKAFLFGVLFMASLSGLGLGLSSFGEIPKTPDDVINTVIKLDDIHFNEMKPNEPVAPPAEKEAVKKTDEAVLKNPVVGVNPTTNIVENKALPKTPVAENGNTTTGTATNFPINSGGGTDNNESKKTFTGTATTGMLDKQPEFPGGMDKFYSFVAAKFEKPNEEIDGTVKVIVSFVIEPDGTMTDIMVARDPGYGLAKEAIRVLKSLKTKWNPGIIDGEKVRTAFSLPIVIKLE